MFNGKNKFYGIIIGACLILNGNWIRQGLGRQAGYDTNIYGIISFIMGWLIVAVTLGFTNLFTSPTLRSIQNIPNLVAGLACVACIVFALNVLHKDSTDDNNKYSLQPLLFSLSLLIVAGAMICKNMLRYDTPALLPSTMCIVLAYIGLVSSSVAILPWEREHNVTDGMGTMVFMGSWLLLALGNYLPGKI
jgi:hypothetical protein